MLEAAEAMAKKRFPAKRTIYFAFSHDEETAGTSVPKASRHCWPRARPARFRGRRGAADHRGMIKGLEKSAALIAVAEKGYATLVLSAQARPGIPRCRRRDTAIAC